MTPEDGHYIHGTHPDEQRRLSLLNDLLNENSLGALSLSAGERVIDVGSGLGQLARAMGGAVRPGGSVVGIERDPKQLDEARRRATVDGEEQLVEFRPGDAVDLPLTDSEWGSFDVAHARFLLEHVPDPLAVVRSMVRAVRPGGRIVLEDDDHDVLRLYPELPGIDALWRAYIRSYERLGNDPFVGRHLVALLHRAGATPVRNNYLFFGSCSGSPSFPGFVDNFAGVIEGAREHILSTLEPGSIDFDAAVSTFREWGRRPDAALWYGTFWAEGRRPD